MKTTILGVVSLVLLLIPRLNFAENVNLEVIHKIKQEAFYQSRVMDYVHLIADENGPRMSGSEGYRRAANSAVNAYHEAGIEKAGLEKWGTFGRGWEWSRVAVQMKKPHETTLSAYPADFSSPTQKPVAGQVIFAPIWELESDAPENGDLEKLARQIEVWKDKYRGKLAGKAVMMDHPKKFKLPTKPAEYRFSEEALSEIGGSGYNGNIDPGPVPNLEWPIIAYPVDKDKASRVWEVMPLEYAADRWKLEVQVTGRIAAFLVEQGAVAVLKTGRAKGAGVIMHSDYGSYIDGIPSPHPRLC